MPNLSKSTISLLAMEGGKPVRGTWLPYGRQSIDDSDVEAVVAALRSDWLTQGPRIAEFEKALSEICGVKFAVAICNGTAALHAAYYAIGIAAGDEVVMPAMTFAATANAALYLGAKPVFVDIHPNTGLIDVEAARRAITSKTKAIVGVDFAGQPCDMKALRALADEKKLPLIIDGAHSLGALYDGVPPSQIADLTTFSFHPVKTITTGEGGAIVTNNAEYARRMQQFRTHGIEKNSERFVNENQGPWYHEMQDLGFNYRITDFQAALGTSQLKRLDKFVARRREIAAAYRKQLAPLQQFRCLEENANVKSAYHLFPVMVVREPVASSRKFAVEALHAENIGVQIHYLPVYQHPYYTQHVLQPAPNCPNTDKFYQGIINLPIFPTMSDADIADVVAALSKIEEVFATR